MEVSRKDRGEAEPYDSGNATLWGHCVPSRPGGRPSILSANELWRTSEAPVFPAEAIAWKS